MSNGGRALGFKACRLSSRGLKAVLLLIGCTSAKAAGPVIVTHHLRNKRALSQSRASLDRATVSQTPSYCSVCPSYGVLFENKRPPVSAGFA